MDTQGKDLSMPRVTSCIRYGLVLGTHSPVAQALLQALILARSHPKIPQCYHHFLGQLKQVAPMARMTVV